jgi:uncharacterized protein
VSRILSPFRFVVSDLVNRPGERRAESAAATVDWGIELSRLIPEEGLAASVSIEGVSGGVYVAGSVTATAEHTCHRCTAVWTEEIEVPVAEMLETDPSGEYPLDGEVADLEPVLRDAVLLALPLVPTCRPDCLGLCARCGADLNTGACPGHEEESSSPFAGLRELLEP